MKDPYVFDASFVNMISGDSPTSYKHDERVEQKMKFSRYLLGTFTHAVVVVGSAAFVPQLADASDAPWATAVYENTIPADVGKTTSHDQIQVGSYADTRVGINADNVPFNHVYYMVPHNTYEYDPSRDNHDSGITVMLNAGWRAIELDVEHRYEDDTDDDWVSHGDQENRNTCSAGRDDTYLSGCLEDVKNWLAGKGKSLRVPIVIELDTKGEYDEVDDLRGLSRQVASTLGGSKLITPQEILAVLNTSKYNQSGRTYRSLREAVAQMGWPTMRDMMSQGQVLVLFTGNTSQYGSYIDDIPANRSGNWILPCPPMQNIGDYVASSTPMGYNNSQKHWIVCGNVVWGDHKQEVLNQAYASNQMTLLWINPDIAGYADIEEYGHAYKAVAHGAQFISRNPKDYTYTGSTKTIAKYNKQNTFHNHLPLLGIRRSVPGYFQMVYNGGRFCVDNNRGTANGKDTHLWVCSNTNQNQQYVYTMEGQLRTRSATSRCHDIDGGDASGADKQIHLWDCDGGASEKWELQWDSSSFLSHEDEDYGFGVDTAK